MIEDLLEASLKKITEAEIPYRAPRPADKPQEEKETVRIVAEELILEANY